MTSPRNNEQSSAACRAGTGSRDLWRLLSNVTLAATMFISLSLPLLAQVISIPELDRLVRRGIDLAGKQQYSKAMAEFTSAMSSYPDHPAGHLNKAVLLEVMSLDFETPVPAEFNALLSSCETLAERMIKTNPRSAEGYFYLGMTYSHIAYHAFREGSDWIGGLRHGLKANAAFEDCFERDPDAFDAMTASGTYKYWKSRRMSFLTWTPFVDDERVWGIQMLHTAALRARYTSAQALNSLVWIYIEEENFDAAIRTARHALRHYPANRLFLWGLASAAEKKGDRITALDAYRRIVGSVDGEVRESRYILIQARAKIARLSFEAGDTETARRECEWVLRNARIDTTPFTSDGDSRIRRRTEDMEELHEELR